MLFNSLEYVLFLPAVILLYYLVPGKFRWILLLGASYYFYACWKLEYLGLIVFSTLTDYFAALKMGKADHRKKRKPWLILSLVVNLGLLFFFKYYNFVSESYTVFMQEFNVFGKTRVLDVLLPVGISFYTFQTLSYSIEVYKGKLKPEKHLGVFAVYVSFFPQLVAGPIERFDRLGPQLRKKIVFTYQNFARGMRLILYGLFVKMVVADNLAVHVDAVYNNLQLVSGTDILTGMFFYSFQIYADFFGYSLIAIGSALTLGVTLMDNFNTPYLSKNISEFWQRWHISLSTWFRDYVFIPLGGSRVKTGKWIFNILLVFTVSGLWHGANWTFVIWGAIFGIAYLLENFSHKAFGIKHSQNIFLNGLLMLKTFVIVTIAWVFFRSSDLLDVGYLFESLQNNMDFYSHLFIHPLTWVFLGVLIVSDFILYNKRFDTWCEEQHILVRWTIYLGLLFSIIVFAGVEEFPFIYFQF